MSFFNNKADTLSKLSKLLKKSKIPKLKIYKIQDFKTKKYKIINDIKKNFKGKVAVRSSSINEDNNKTTNAGKFVSVLNVPLNDLGLIDSINKVVSSYRSKKEKSFFVQSMADDIIFSGVCFSESLSNSLKGYEINYTSGKKTNLITSGLSNGKKIFYVDNKKFKLNNYFNKLLNAIKEIEQITKNNKLDVEFAISKNKTIFVLQVRKLLSTNSIGSKNTKIVLEKLSKKILKLKRRTSNLYGKKTYFGVMPDWNPAEIIGIKPKALSLSLYKYLITDNIWSENRERYGYYNVYPYHLLTTFYGTPFVDLRIDFNSWLPSSLPNYLKEKITNLYLKKFLRNKENHDKIEFEIIYTCLSFDTKNRIIKELTKNNFTKSEINLFINSLREITKNTIKYFNEDYKVIKLLPKKQNVLESSNIYEVDKIFWLLNDCKKFGTLPFAGLARCGFVAMEFLNSLVRMKIITSNDKFRFLSSIKTITGSIINDYKKLNKKKFLHRYGHLRPNTYEISVKNYTEGYNYYFKDKQTEGFNKIKTENFIFTKDQQKRIVNLMYKNNINLNYSSFIKFLRNSIKYREEAKFIFTKSIDMIFKNIKILARRIGLDYNEFSHVDINSILELHNNLDSSDLKDKFNKEILVNKMTFEFNKNIKLQDVICELKDIFIHSEILTKPNYIGSERIYSKSILINPAIKQKLNKSIVLIENADPGYDFIFNSKISGLITKYGGANSHMAIRCSELSIPAAIGIGETKFEELKFKKFISIDCLNKRIH